MSPRLRSISPVMAAVVLSAATAAADPIQITSGSLQWRSGGSAIPITLSGEDFTFTGATNRTEGVFMPIEQCEVPECRAGVTVDLHSFFVGNGLPGTATFEGTTYTAVGSLDGTSAMTAEWTGALPIPAGFTGGTLFAPVLFQGQFAFEEDPTLPWRTVALFGSGTATVSFSPWPGSDFPGALMLDAVTFEFQAAGPVPEPASLLLMGTGLGAMAATRRRRAQAQH